MEVQAFPSISQLTERYTISEDNFTAVLLFLLFLVAAVVPEK